MPVVVGFIAGGLGITAGVSAAVVGSAAYAAGASVLGTFIVKTAVSVGISAILAQLRGAPSVPKPSSRLVSGEQPVTAMEIVYGRVRKSGPLAFRGWADCAPYKQDDSGVVKHAPEEPAGTWTLLNGKRRSRIYSTILASHRIRGTIVQHYLDDRQVTIDADGAVQTDPMAEAGYLYVYNGIAGQESPLTLQECFPGWTSDHDMKGLAHILCVARKQKPEQVQEVYPTGRAWSVSPVIDGWNQIYDPRDDSTGFTRNAALIIAHWLTEVHGRSVDWDEVAVEADVCDEVVTDRDGVTGPRWQIDVVLDRSQSFEQQRAQLAVCCDCHFLPGLDGTVRFRVGRWIEPTVTLEPADFATLTLSTGVDRTDDYTQTVVEYTEPANDWREAQSAPYIAEAASLPRTDTIPAFGVSWHNQAWRVAKRMSAVRRADVRIQCTIGPVGYELMAERFVAVTHPELGLDAAPFEITRLSLVGLGMWEIEARSTAEADFDPDVQAEEPPRPETGSTSYNLLPADRLLTGIAAETLDNSGALGRVKVSWDALQGEELARVRWRQPLQDGWSYRMADAGATSLELELEEGPTWQIQVRAVSGVGDGPRSRWSPDTVVQISPVANTVVPAQVDPLTISETGGVVTLHNYGPGYSGAFDFADGTLVHTEYGLPNRDESYSTGTLAAGVWAFWVASINSSGVEGNPRERSTTIT